MEGQIFEKEQHGIRNFFRMLWKAKLPYGWIIGYIISGVLITNIGISATEYTAEMFAGNVGLVSVVLPFLAVTLLSLFIGSLSGVLVELCKARIDRNMRRMVWSKAVHLPYRYYDNRNPKELLSRITTDVSSVSSLVMVVFVGTITSAYSVFATLKRIGSYDTRLMLVLIAILPVNLGIAFVLGKMRFGINNQVNQKNAQLTETIAESSENLLLVKAMGTEQAEWKKGMKRADTLYHTTVLNSWIASISSPAYAISGMLQFMLIVLVGRSFYSSGAITLAEWVAYFAFANNIVNHLTGYCGDWATFKASQGATKRITDLMLEPEEPAESGILCEGFSGEISFSDVNFGYGEKLLFEHLNLNVPEGQVTAIIGPSGSGKTTILNLLERFYEPNSGKIAIGDKNIAEYQRKSYREHLGYVTQETTLFSGTLRENLLWGSKERIPEEQILEVCQKVGLGDLLMENGLELVIGEDGLNLSGGQRQRIAIAQMILRRPRYVLLDEATSAIDIAGKDMIFETIREELKGSTIVMVAHDRQTVQKADTVIVLEAGKVTAQGTLKKLQESEPFVQKLMGGSRE